jgi:hypothetical protein
VGFYQLSTLEMQKSQYNSRRNRYWMLPKHHNDDILFVVGSKKGGNAIEGTIDF